MTAIELQAYHEEWREFMRASEMARDLFPQQEGRPRLLFSTTPAGENSWFRVQHLPPERSEAILSIFLLPNSFIWEE